MEYRIIPQMSYDWLISTYFFLGGIGAGCFILSVMANYWNKTIKPLAKTAAFVAPVAIAIGLAILLLDLGRPLRAIGFLVNFNPTSALSYGFWFLNIFFILSLAHVWFLKKGDEVKVKQIAYAGLPFAILSGIYTGVLLTQAPARALWHSPLLPLMFLVGGIISGGAIVLLLSSGKEPAASTGLGKVIAYFLIAELCLVLLEIVTMLNGGIEASNVIRSLMTGPYKVHFWVIEIALGGIIPAIILLRGKSSDILRITSSVLILIGIYMMRYIVVVGGQILQAL